MGCNSTDWGVGAGCGAALGNGGGASSFLQEANESPTNIDVTAKQHCTERFILSSERTIHRALDEI